MRDFLDKDALFKLTGRRYAPAQKRVLRERKIRFSEDDFGRPVVLWATIEARLLGHIQTDQPRPGPDFTHFPKVA